MPRFETRQELHAWLEQNGLAHVARFNLEAVAAGVEPGLWKQLRSIGARRRLTDLACTESIARSTDWLPPSPLRALLPGLVTEFIENERVAAQRARASVNERLAGSGEVHARLLELRSRVPDPVAPRVSEALHHGAPAFLIQNLKTRSCSRNRTWIDSARCSDW